MISRRGLLGSIGAWALDAASRAWASVPRPKRNPAPPIPDAVLDRFGTPYIDRMLADPAFRRAFTKQTDRVWGRKFRLLCYKIATDEHPEIKRFWRIDRALRRHLGL